MQAQKNASYRVCRAMVFAAGLSATADIAVLSCTSLKFARGGILASGVSTAFLFASYLYVSRFDSEIALEDTKPWFRRLSLLGISILCLIFAILCSAKEFLAQIRISGSGPTGSLVNAAVVLAFGFLLLITTLAFRQELISREILEHENSDIDLAEYSWLQQNYKCGPAAQRQCSV